MRARLADAGGGRFQDDIASGLLTETNRFRASQGLKPLEWDDSLASCSRAHAADMVRRHYFAHEAPEGFTHADRVSLLDRDLCGQTAENLAWRDYPSQRTTATQFEAMWEASAGHRRNLTNPDFTRVGYGVVQIGSACYAAGVYSEVAVRLAAPLPLRISGEAELNAGIQSASPRIAQLSLTAPFAHPTWMAAPTDAMPALPPGAWQLRPLRPRTGLDYDVLTGPLFFVS